MSTLHHRELKPAMTSGLRTAAPEGHDTSIALTHHLVIDLGRGDNRGPGHHSRAAKPASTTP